MVGKFYVFSKKGEFYMVDVLFIFYIDLLTPYHILDTVRHL